MVPQAGTPSVSVACRRTVYSTVLTDQDQPKTSLVVSAMVAVKQLGLNAGTSEQEMAIPKAKQLNNMMFNNNLNCSKVFENIKGD